MHSTKLLSQAMLAILAAGSLTVTGCDELAGAIATHAGGRDGGNTPADLERAPTDDERLGIKLAGYIQCINSTSVRVHEAADRYFQWVDPQSGVTGKETTVFGTYELDDQARCKDAVAASAPLQPPLPEVEQAGQAYLAALDGLLPLAQDAYSYYDENNYKDDAFAKGIAMHPKLVAGFNAFAEADADLRGLIDARNDALLERELARIEKQEGRKLRFLSRNILARAKKLVRVAAHDVWEDVALEPLQTELAAYGEAVEETMTYVDAHKQEAASLTTYHLFTEAATDLLKQAKALMRRKRDDQPWTERELSRLPSFPPDGHPASVGAAFNELVEDSNGLDWSDYQPS